MQQVVNILTEAADVMSATEQVAHTPAGAEQQHKELMKLSEEELEDAILDDGMTLADEWGGASCAAQG
jgi:hypothetical protein